MLRKVLKYSSIAFLFILIMAVFFTSSGCSSVQNNKPVSVNAIWTDTVPQAGTGTIYGIPLSLENTREFLNWFYTIELSSEEEHFLTEALGSLKSPCCDEYTLDAC